MRSRGRSSDEKEAEWDTQGGKAIKTGTWNYIASKVKHIDVIF